MIASASDVLARAAERTRAYDFTVWFWGDAIALDGLLEAADLLGDARSEEHCRRFFAHWATRPLTWVDHLTPGGALLHLAERSDQATRDGFMAAALRLAEWLDQAPRSEHGAPLYRPDLPPYRHTVWVDTLYHEPSFLARLGALTGDAHWFGAALACWNSHLRALSGPEGPFLAHAYDAGARLRRGYGWGRGAGWALLGMIDTLELLPATHPDRRSAVANFCDLATAVLDIQDASGFWRTLLWDREAYLESSTAAFFGAAFTKAVRLGVLDSPYAAAADRAWSAMLSRMDEDGSFYGVSACTYASTLPTDDVGMYRTLPTEVNVWGQGSAMRFAAERLRSGAQ